MNDEARQHRFTLPSGATDMVLIRHGETQAAVKGQMFPMVDGQGDPALRAEGEVQALAVAERLKTEPINAIYVTTMQRTLQTAAPLATALGLTPAVEPDLREVFLGDWDGGEYRFRAAAHDPAFIRARDAEEWGEIPGAETTAALHKRVVRGLWRIAAAHPDQMVAVVVHGGVVGAALALATGSRPFAFNGANNGSISRLVVARDRMILRGFNDCAHLPA
ncbi:histidine phosphatase family protein [Sulfitobacter sp. JB4-11]|uniref:histidine phosphatase family protein n=1 Tax=Sulfitobacter rhodophyticola TaxID=3238304 RepID=UPI003516EC65